MRKNSAQKLIYTFQSIKSTAIKHLGFFSFAPAIIDKPTGPHPETTTVSLNAILALSTPWSPKNKCCYFVNDNQSFLKLQ